MNILKNKKIAIVCDWLKDFGGAELVVEHILEAFPEADIYTSVFFLEGRKAFVGRKIYTSFLQKIPFLGRSHKLALTLRPRAFESFDLSAYDVVISSSSAESKGILTKPGTIHFCYCHTPTRYFWSHYHEYLHMMEFGILNPLAKLFMPRIVHKLRMWDFLASKRVDYFLSNSQNTARRIEKYYKKPATVLYPWLDIANIPFCETKEDYYFYNGRCIPYKKFDLVVEAFNANGKKLIVATNTKNKLAKHLQKISKSNISWIFDGDLEKINALHSKAKAFLFPPEEDFGLVPIAAMATGTPVIAYGKWWATETVKDGVSGIFFTEQTTDSLNNAIERFEKMQWNAKDIRKHAMHFDKNLFQKNLIAFIEEKLWNT